MGGHHRRRVLVAAVLVTLAVLAGCSSDDAGDGEEAVTFTARAPEEIAPPPAEGNGIVLPQPASAMPDGYVQEEYLVGGTATRFDAVDTPDDGAWTATPGEEAEYRTRVIVRRPAAARDFSGTVVVEWFNVSAIESSPDWAYLSQEIGRQGHAYIGVSTQAQGCLLYTSRCV